jgi:hypothetical protein
LRALSLCTCCRQYPGAATGRRLRSSHPALSAFPEIAVGSACTSSFSRLARRLLALRPAHSRRHLYVTCYTEGFSHFVTSMTAPVASGWSVRRVGLAPTGKRRLLTAHANSGHSPTVWWMGQIDPEHAFPVGPIWKQKARKRFFFGEVRRAPTRAASAVALRLAKTFREWMAKHESVSKPSTSQSFLRSISINPHWPKHKKSELAQCLRNPQASSSPFVRG